MMMMITVIVGKGGGQEEQQEDDIGVVNTLRSNDKGGSRDSCIRYRLDSARHFRL